MRKQQIIPTTIDLHETKAGECLLLRYEVESETHRETRTAAVCLFEDANTWTALDTGLHARVEVICGPAEWGSTAELIISGRTEISIKPTGTEPIKVSCSGIASNRNVTFRAYR